MKKVLILAIVLAVTCSCSNLDPLKQYVSADKDTFQVITPEYKEFVEKSDMSQDEKDRRTRLIESWQKRIENTENALKEE
jgi:hypothetical protein